MPAVATSRLPPHHIRRPRLIDACADTRVVVVEAAGGYGKSVLAAELVEARALVPIWVLLEEGGVSAQLLVGRLRTALTRAGLRDAAAAISGAGDDTVGAVDAMLATLAGESCAILIDDAHHAARDAARLIDRLAHQLAGPQTLVVLARHLPPGLERLRRADTIHLTAGDLALSPEEVVELCRTGFNLHVSPEDSRRLDEATGGWTAAVVLAASRARRTSQTIGQLALSASARADALDSVLEEAVATLGPNRAALAQIARLPVIDQELLAELTGEPDFFERALAAGLPMTRSGNDWWELPGPVRDRLETLGSPDPAALRDAALHYESRGELGSALQMLLAAGLGETAAQLLHEAEPRVIETIDVLELLSVVDRIPQPVLDRHPLAMLHTARMCGAYVLIQERSRLLARADAAIGERTPQWRRALDAELLVDIINGGDPLAALDPARRVLEAAGDEEQFTRARALSALGQATCWRRDPEGRLSSSILREAGDYLDRAADIYLRSGYSAAAAGVLLYRGGWVEFGLGRAQGTYEIFSRGMALAADHPRRFLRQLYYRTWALTELGRFEEALADLDEVSRISQQFSDHQMACYVEWQRMVISSLRGDAESAVRHAQQVEATRGDWWTTGGANFLADAADCLDRVGETALADEYLARAERDPQDAERHIAMAEAALLARHGDPDLAEARLSVVDQHGIPPREYWRVTLLRACSALRRDDRAAGPLAARAFEEAARLGLPHVPMVREREVTESLLALAVETGLPAARALEAAALPVALFVLGRFALTRGGRPVALRPGQGAQMLKIVAVSGGGLHAEEAIEALWPDVDPSAGRNRLRTVLGRLNEAAGDVVHRDGDRLALNPDVRLDLDRFHHEARHALALGVEGGSAAVANARSAIARYRGPLLPHDPYAEWAAEPREAAGRTMLNLLDLCAEVAAARGDLDEARRIVERTIELAPYEDDRYLRVAMILHDQGRKGAALSVLRRARSALAQIGIDPPKALAALEARVARTGERDVTLV